MIDAFHFSLRVCVNFSGSICFITSEYIFKNVYLIYKKKSSVLLFVKENTNPSYYYNMMCDSTNTVFCICTKLFFS